MPVSATAHVYLCVRTHVRWLILKRCSDCCLTLLIFEEWLRTERSPHTHTHSSTSSRERHVSLVSGSRTMQSLRSGVNKDHSWISFSLNGPPSTKHSTALHLLTVKQLLGCIWSSLIYKDLNEFRCVNDSVRLPIHSMRASSVQPMVSGGEKDDWTAKLTWADISLFIEPTHTNKHSHTQTWR